jgi:outer membrane protein assembly factor BamB
VPTATAVVADGGFSVAVDLDTGEQRWQAEFTALNAGTTAVLGRNPGVHEDGPVTGRDARTGEVLWESDTDVVAGEVAPLSGPLRWDDLVHGQIGPTCEFGAFDLRRGESAWQAEPSEAGWPLSAGEGAIVVDEDRTIALIDFATGRQLWTATARDDQLIGYVSSAVIDGGRVITAVVKQHRRLSGTGKREPDDTHPETRSSSTSRRPTAISGNLHRKRRSDSRLELSCLVVPEPLPDLARQKAAL